MLVYLVKDVYCQTGTLEITKVCKVVIERGSSILGAEIVFKKALVESCRVQGLGRCCRVLSVGACDWTLLFAVASLVILLVELVDYTLNGIRLFWSNLFRSISKL